MTTRCPCKIKKTNCCPPRTLFTQSQSLKSVGSEKRFCFPKVSYPSIPDHDLDYGFSIGISGNGEVMAIGAPKSFVGDLPNPGVVFIYERKKSYSPCPTATDRDFFLKQIIVATNPKTQLPDFDANGQFGYSISVSYNGTFIVIGAPTQDNLPDQKDDGCVYMFIRSGQLWFSAQQIFAEIIDENGKVLPDDELHSGFGSTVAISRDDRILMIGNSTYRTERDDNTGAVYVYEHCAASFGICDPPKNPFELKQIVTAAEAQAFIGGDDFVVTHFGYSLAMNGNGQFLFIGFVGGRNQDGVVILQRTSQTCGKWNISQYLPGSDASNGFFGSSIAVTPDGRVLVVFSPNEPLSNEREDGFGVIYAYQPFGCNKSLQTQYVDLDHFAPLPNINIVGSTVSGAIAISDDGCLVAAGFSNSTVSEVQYDGSVITFEREKIVLAGVQADLWSQKQIVVQNPLTEFEYFGNVLSMTGDGSALAVGAFGTIDPNVEDFTKEEVVLFSSRVKSCATTKIK